MKQTKRKPQGATRTTVEKKVAKPALRERVSLKLPMKLLRGVAVIGVVLALVMGGNRVLDRLDQPITRVQIAGELTHLDQAIIAEWVQGQITDGVLRTDLRSLQRQLQEQPWIAKATVRRQWPGVLAIRLQERVAVARWNNKDLLTANGEVFKPQQLPVFEELPHLWGVDVSGREVLQQFRWLQEQFDAMDLKVITVSKAQRGAWQVEVLSQLTDSNEEQAVSLQVAFGKHHLVERLERFKTLYESVLQARINEIDRVDLRYTNGITVQWKNAEKVT
ncbi:MAG: FtsQ-type POTRA domain-containing protein [Pseudomonadales bacterium]